MNIQNTPSDVCYSVIDHPHNKELTIISALSSNRFVVDCCNLTDPNIPPKKFKIETRQENWDRVSGSNYDGDDFDQSDNWGM